MKSFRFFDSARHWRDIKITADPQPRNPGLFPNSTAWNGRLAEVVAAVVATINTLPAKDRGLARSFAVRSIADAEAPPGHPSRELGHDLDASPSVKQNDETETATPAAMNDANRNYWDRAGNRYLSRDAAAIAAPGSIRAINLANSQFYGSQPKAPGRRWGER